MFSSSGFNLVSYLIKRVCFCAKRLYQLFIEMSKVTVERFQKPKFFNFVVCNPCQSSPSLTIRVLFWFIIISLVFFYPCKVLFSGFLQFNGNFVNGENNSKYLDCALFIRRWYDVGAVGDLYYMQKARTGLVHQQLERNFKDKILTFT